MELGKGVGGIRGVVKSTYRNHSGSTVLVLLILIFGAVVEPVSWGCVVAKEFLMGSQNTRVVVCSGGL